MADVLRAPWLLSTALEDLAGEAEQLGSLHNTVKLVQIIQFISSDTESTHLLGHLSDKFHYIVSLFTDGAIGKFVSRHPRWKLTDIQGGLVRLVEYRFVRVPDPQTDASTIVLVVEAFEHVGGDGSHVLGDPRYIMSNPAVAGALSLWKSAPFAHGLEGRDLQFLTATCTQTLHSVQTSYPVTIADGDWQISEAQTVRLAAVHLPRYETFQYASESDEEPVPMPQKRRLSFSDLQGGVPTSLSLQTQDMRFSQVAGASTPNGALSFGASTPAPAPAEYPDYASW